MLSRRSVLESGAALVGTGWALQPLRPAAAADTVVLPQALPAGTRTEAMLEALPGKKPLIRLSYRPPNYETPIEYFRTPITPNDAFFVRYHLADIPEVGAESINAKTWKLTVGGDGANGRTQLSLDELKAMPAHEIAAVCQCSGNRRGLFEPHVAGVEWGYGAMGCATWKGARLKDVLDKVGLKKEAVEIVMNGADGPVLDKTPDFIKSLPVDVATAETALIAYEMNGQPLPHFNGYPARVIVPGWTGTYWVKHIATIDAVTKPFDGFWMKAAYRIPNGKFPIVAHFPTQETAVNSPITEMVVNSLITNLSDGAKVKAGLVEVSGVAWDAGYGIRSVEVSADGGKSWSTATLGPDLGRFAFRPWSYSFDAKRGANTVTVRASNGIGQTQTAALIPNPAGYHHNVMQSLTVTAS
jgi:DMSO/TMAO reductase YedYZ molybdopterin-dependent catalytic subunit